MIRKLPGILFLILLTCLSYAQNGSIASSNGVPGKTDSIPNNLPKELVITPTIGIGTGMFSFYGDLYNKHFQAPMVSRLAFDLSLSQPINNALQFNFYVLFGKLGANERFAANNRNLNFESQIRAGGLNLQYNFDNFLPKKRSASPFISFGIESFEFLSKTDIKDQNGNTYYYWTDGYTRNIDENAVNAASSIEIQRDYTYESDIRELNLDGFGKYAERSFALPVGAGAIFKLNDFFDFKLGATMHFTFTDYIDGVTEKSRGNRKGDSRNDNFMMTSFSIHYSLGMKQREKRKAAKSLEEHYKDTDFFALDTEDQDQDGVTDFNDACAGTPLGAKVDLKGCPLDGDEDGVPDYKDDELKTPKKAYVNLRGVRMSDSLIAYQFKLYMDTTGSYGLVETRDADEIKAGQKEYAVQLGSFKKGLPPELMTKFLSIKDISSATTGDSETIYTAGKFNNYEAAEARKQKLLKDGLADLKIVYKLNGKYYDASGSDIVSATTTTTTITTPVKGQNLPTDLKGKFIGEDKTPLVNSKVNLLNEEGEILETTKTDAFGSFKFNYLAADKNVLYALDQSDPQLKKLKRVFLANSKGDKVTEVFPNTAVFNVNNSTLASNNPSTKTNTNKTNTNTSNTINNVTEAHNILNSIITNTKNTTTVNNTSSTAALNTQGTVLRVQLGAYKKRLSKAVFKNIDDLIEIKTDDGLYKYMTGSFTSFDAAAKHKVEMLLNGYPGAFIAAYKDGKRITLQEAGATLSEKTETTPEPADNNVTSGANKKLVKFKVQVGVFKNNPPDSKLAIYSKLRDLTGEKTKSGLNRYVVGSFGTYKEAEAFKNNIIKEYGLTDAFVVALFNNEYISIPEALELLK
ncbi:MAG: hypothetical protein V4608_16010 [Bacteroidota bacterium]